MMSSEINTSAVVRIRPQHLACELDGELMLLHMESGKYYGLNPVGTAVWNQIQEPRTVASIHDSLLKTYEVAADECLRDLRVLLASLQKAGLIEISDGPLRQTPRA
jgi:hypothetical protein